MTIERPAAPPGKADGPAPPESSSTEAPPAEGEPTESTPTETAPAEVGDPRPVVPADEPSPVVAAEEHESSPAAVPPPRRRHRRWLRPAWPALEILTAVASALLLPWLSLSINVDPLDRIGQVSGLAGIQLRFAIVAGALIGVLLLAHRLLPARHHYQIMRLGCAVAAGLASGVVAAGLVVALHGTPWALWGAGGDYRILLTWIGQLDQGQDVPDYYPPAILYVLWAWSSMSGLPLGYALQGVQVVGTALFGPAAYLCWRLVLRPGWALGIGVVAMLPFFEPVKPYPQLTLVVLIPLLVAFVRRVRRAGALSWFGVVIAGLLFGAGFGLLFLLYSGWFVWIAPGAVLAIALLAPWRAAPVRALVLLLAAAAAFVAVSRVHLFALFDSAGATQDAYTYIATDTEPTYIAIWTNDRDAWVGSVWPPLGELGGVGLFTLVLAAGLGVAIWLGWRRTPVITLVAATASAWVIRMWLASEMYETELVRLYPRTTMIILYSLLLLTGFAVMYASRVLAGRARPPSAAPAGLLLVPLLFVFASAGSAIADRHMPDRRVDHPGFFAWAAHKQQLIDGMCPEYGRLHNLCDVTRS